MTSQIDATKPVQGTPTTASVRANFTTAASEISALQAATTGGPFLPLAGGTMAGPMYLAGDPTDSRQPATKAYVDAHAGSGGGTGIPEAPTDGALYGRSLGAWIAAVPIAGGVMTGALQHPNGTLAAPSVALGGTNTGLYRTGTNLVVSLQGAAAWTYTPTGAQAAAQLDMTTHAIINLANPTNAQDAATKAYVDSHQWLEAPNDANTYGRHANTWAKAVPVAPRGNIALNTTEPVDVAVSGPGGLGAQVFAWGSAIYNTSYGTYFDGTNWRYRGNGYGFLEGFDPTAGALTWFSFPTGVAGSVGAARFEAKIDATQHAFQVNGMIQSLGGSVRADAGIYPANSTTAAFNLSADANYLYLNYSPGWALAWRRSDGALVFVGAGNTIFSVAPTGQAQVAGGDYGVCPIIGGSYLTLSGAQALANGANLVANGGGRPTYSIEMYWASSRIWMMDTGGNTTQLGYCSATSYPVYSDARLKRNVVPWTTRGLADVTQLQPVSFQYNGEGGIADDGITHYGVIAQDAQLHLPEAVAILAPAANADLPEDLEPRAIPDQLTFDNGTLVFALVNAVKELAARVATLESAAA